MTSEQFDIIIKALSRARHPMYGKPLTQGTTLQIFQHWVSGLLQKIPITLLHWFSGVIFILLALFATYNTYISL